MPYSIYPKQIGKGRWQYHSLVIVEQPEPYGFRVELPNGTPLKTTFGSLEDATIFIARQEAEFERMAAEDDEE